MYPVSGKSCVSDRKEGISIHLDTYISLTKLMLNIYAEICTHLNY